MVWAIFFLIDALSVPKVSASTLLPYSTRTSDYSGFSTNLRGDINSVGMAGATVAVPYSISAAQINPAGYAMSTASVSAQIVSNTIQDYHVQKDKNDYDSNQWGLSLSPSPWGFGVIYYSPTTESGNYISPNTGNALDTEVSVKEIRFAVARAFFENRVSLGVSLGVAKGIRKIGPNSYDGTSFDMEFGALYRLDDHIVIGTSFIPQDTIHVSDDVIHQNDMPGFNRQIISPAQWVGGVAWIPNRFFKVGASLSYIAAIKNAALLADQNKAVGAYATLQPRIGASYVIAEFQDLKIEIATGTYYEPSRIEGETNRYHGTFGFEVNPYFFNAGIGFDLARDYKNLMISAGVDIVRTARFLNLIPEDTVPPYKGFFPPPMEVLADGLPDGMTEGEERAYAPPNLRDVGKIILDIPDRIKEQTSPTPLPTPSPGRKKKKRIKLESTRF